MRKYKLVPVEPTEEMVDAAEDYMEFIDTTGEVWDAMLAAAPPASQDEELVSRLAAVLTAIDPETDHMRDAARAVLKMLEADHG